MSDLGKWILVVFHQRFFQWEQDHLFAKIHREKDPRVLDRGSHRLVIGGTIETVPFITEADLGRLGLGRSRPHNPMSRIGATSAEECAESFVKCIILCADDPLTAVSDIVLPMFFYQEKHGIRIGGITSNRHTISRSPVFVSIGVGTKMNGHDKTFSYRA